MISRWLNRLSDLFAPKVVARPLLNKSERRLHTALSIAMAELARGDLYLMTQVSYGEFLSSPKGTFVSFNSKRADFVITDREFHPVLVIEYQGSGHWGANWISRRNANRRDAIKRRVLRRAGIPLLEIHDGFTLKLVREELGAVFGGPASASAPNVGAGSSTQNSSTPPARLLN